MKNFENSRSQEENNKMIKVKVIPTEIYSRVVGYYRPVQNWNKGKVEEFYLRKTIDPESL
jgi:anaerobic ribonucleoside-triphosphate reductase